MMHRCITKHVHLSQGLGKLSETFPNISNVGIAALRDFLVTPSPILFKLHKRQYESNTGSGIGGVKKGIKGGLPELTVTAADETDSLPRTSYSYTAYSTTGMAATCNSTTTAFEKLRDAAIENLCL